LHDIDINFNNLWRNFCVYFLSFYNINYRLGDIITKYKVTYTSGESNVEFVDFRDIAADTPEEALEKLNASKLPYITYIKIEKYLLNRWIKWPATPIKLKITPKY